MKEKKREKLAIQSWETWESVGRPLISLEKKMKPRKTKRLAQGDTGG